MGKRLPLLGGLVTGLRCCCQHGIFVAASGVVAAVASDRPASDCSEICQGRESGTRFGWIPGPVTLGGQLKKWRFTHDIVTLNGEWVNLGVGQLSGWFLDGNIGAENEELCCVRLAMISGHLQTTFPCGGKHQNDSWGCELHIAITVASRTPLWPSLPKYSSLYGNLWPFLDDISGYDFLQALLVTYFLFAVLGNLRPGWLGRVSSEALGPSGREAHWIMESCGARCFSAV